MKAFIAITSLVAASAVSAQSFVAGWDFDNTSLTATSQVAQWGEQAGSADFAWAHAQAGGPPFFTPAEYAISASFNDTSANDSFSFLAGGVDSITGFDAFSDNFGAAEQGIEFQADNTVTISFDGSSYTSLSLVFAQSVDGGTNWTQQTVDLSAFDGVANAQYQINLGATDVAWDNVAITGTVVPEPSTYAAIFGAIALAVAAVRRRK
ncbi:PEP-CTERM sorting domain-containing protein [Coraliomargarita akajimensis]|uniref:PEP-CTERM protein-sorting domain-containing protein n=1 Tax=Coraliomargarita akajimensis (strain DSM 45221 / IAM 15411 / JCM 23193 / KCTC 12865 / 04OKA010-24) TaxID=583355 RepID=D5EMN8_CORAD|nr:PEP-CTERM sorting domain-containing protein [Coraliomargarita akajimensis]ADE55278.1 protein of unknown function DUF1555 [Coraliomargarita akajimensis DSM 45221]